MIKHTEIRIGNIVKMPSSEQLTVITAMDISDIQSNLKNRLPVELNEKMLLQLGFEKTRDRPGICACYRMKTILITLSNSGNWYFKQRIIKLHDLQNIVYTNTGEDLNISAL